MFCDSFAFAQVMSCFGCFGGSERSRHSPNPYDDDTYSHDSGETSNPGGDDEEGEEEEEVEELSRSKRSEEILKCKLQNGLVCRQFPVKETNKLTRGEVCDFLCSCRMCFAEWCSYTSLFLIWFLGWRWKQDNKWVCSWA